MIATGKRNRLPISWLKYRFREVDSPEIHLELLMSSKDLWPLFASGFGMMIVAVAAVLCLVADRPSPG